MDLASTIDELNHSGFIFGNHQLEVETLHPKIAKGIMKIIPTEFKRNINILEETQYKKQTPNAHGQVNYVSSIFALQHV